MTAQGPLAGRPASEPAENGPLIYLIAGEPSGDQLGGRLMKALKAATDGKVRFAGVGGAQMAKQGLQSLFPMDELAVMGLVEVLPHLPLLLRRMAETEAHARQVQPDLLLTIDAPGFSLRVAKKLKGAGFPLVHYVAPSVWAWKPGRARKISRYLDHLLALLPFEPPYFEVHGLKTSFIGHPVIEALAGVGDSAALLDRLQIAETTPLLTVLPGSRRGEVSRLAPVFGNTVARLAKTHPDLQVLLPTVPSVEGLVRQLTADWPVPVHVLPDAGDKYAAFKAGRAALAASGTVAVELAVAGTPTVVGYRMNHLTSLIVRRLLKVPYASIANLVLNRQVQPEFLQEYCTVDALHTALSPLMELNSPERQEQLAGLKEAVACLSGAGEGTPSQQAARVLLDLLAEKSLPPAS
ncbi:lipid-A-disaccharide synthase [Rhodovibrionaceae bacterium A322]